MKHGLTEWHEQLKELQRMCWVFDEETVEIDIEANQVTIELWTHDCRNEIVHSAKRNNIQDAVKVIYDKVVKSGLPWQEGASA